MSTSTATAPRPFTRAKHPVDEVLPVGKLAVYGVQHVLAFYAGAVIVPILLAGGGTKGLVVIYGAVIVAGLFTFLIAPFFSRLIRYFPPVVTGSVITIIGIALLPVAALDAVGGGSNPKPANGGNLAYAIGTLLLIVLIQRFFRGFLATIAVLIGLVVGTLVAWALGDATGRRPGDHDRRDPELVPVHLLRGERRAGPADPDQEPLGGGDRRPGDDRARPAAEDRGGGRRHPVTGTRWGGAGDAATRWPPATRARTRTATSRPRG